MLDNCHSWRRDMRWLRALGRSDVKTSILGCSNNLSISPADLQSGMIFLQFHWKDQLALYFFCSWKINNLLDHLGICHLRNSLATPVWLHCIVRTDEERSPGLQRCPCKPPWLVVVASPLESHLLWGQQGIPVVASKSVREASFSWH